MPAETILLSSLPPLLQRPTFNIKRQLQLRVVVFVAKRSNCWCCWLCNTVTILCLCMRVLLFTFIAICWPDNKRDKRKLNVGILFIYLFTSPDLSQDFLMSLILWSGICSLMHGWGNTDEDYYIFFVLSRHGLLHWQNMEYRLRIWNKLFPFLTRCWVQALAHSTIADRKCME